MTEVCGQCGGRVIYRTVDETPYGSGIRQTIKVPDRCSKPSCPNANPANLPASGWTVQRV